MTQSSELAGGEGFTFEDNVAAFYLTALLAEAYAPGIDDRTVVRVSVQERDFDEPLDDVIVDFEDIEKNPARLSLQVKRSLTISKAKTNKDFREVVRDSWATLKKSNFRINLDRYGAAVGTISASKERTLKTLCDHARESLTVEHFDARFSEDGNASKAIKRVKSDFVALLEETKGAPCAGEEVHQFLAHFVLIQFDFLREGAVDPPEAINRIRDCLAPQDAAKAPVVWSKTVQLARASAGKSGQFDRARLVRAISPVARLRGATSLRTDLDKLAELASSYASLIPDDIGGTRLERPALLESLDAKLAKAPIVQIHGLPGSGKSVVVKRAVDRALEHGPVIFLKAEQLEGTSWISYATSQGLSSAPLEKLLVEVAAAGIPTLFIDAIDRISRKHQSVIENVVHTIEESPLLDNWQVVFSLRDNGIEMLHNWLGDFLEKRRVERLLVGQLDDKEADMLARAKPHLRPLLFGSEQVRQIVRRPFFAKVLDQSFMAALSAPTFAPQSEVDLIGNWWRRGGYNETGQRAVERQRTLLDLAGIHARQLSRPIGLTQLTSVANIDALVSDGILRYVREGVSVRFAHDIFFEWAFFHVLAAQGQQWLEAIRECGEPPSLARVVELTSQWEYSQGTDWSASLALTEAMGLRSQWLRAWLFGPLGTEKFEVDEEQFAIAVFADDYRLFRKVLVWFQAEKTTANENILAGGLPRNQRQKFADLLGWPSDASAWRRLIDFIHRRISDIPQRLFPEIVAIFGVWQNALAGHSNPVSHKILQQCATWIESIDSITTAENPVEKSDYWKKVPGLGSFRKSLVQLLLYSSTAEPNFANELLQKIIDLERIDDDLFRDIIIFSPILAQSLPRPLVDLSLAFLRKELPAAKASRQKQRLRDAAERRAAILAKPEAERSDRERMALSSGFHLPTFDNFVDRSWGTLSIHDDRKSFWPPSPLREPFHSLFQSSPDEALRLLRELCNHAITAWRQLHRHLQGHKATPVPLKLAFPWGTQRFWGNNQKYLWFRSTMSPQGIGSGLMALEEWSFTELERGCPVGELIQRILEGNESIAILGIAAMIALHTETVSDTTLPIITSQRLLDADLSRWVQDSSSTTSLIGFNESTDMRHIEAIQAAKSRPVRMNQLSWMIPKFVFAAEPLRGRAREALLNFKNNLPFEYEEERDFPEVKAYLTARALQYAELAEMENYQVYPTDEDSDQVAIIHVSPSAMEPENIAKVEHGSKWLRQMGLWSWASESIKEKTLSDTYTINDAIAVAKEADTNDLFDYPTDEKEEMLCMRQGAVAATAAVTLSFREGLAHEDLEWSRDVLERAIRLPEKPDWMRLPVSDIPWHPANFVARGLAADLGAGTAVPGAAHDLLGLIAHPLQIASLASLEEACQLWSKDSKLTWAALVLAFSLCHVPRQQSDQAPQDDQAIHSPSATQSPFDAALVFYENGSGWPPLPLPPPAWEKIKPGERRLGYPSYAEYDVEDAINAAEVWAEPEVSWRSKQAADILERIPFEEILSSDAKDVLLEFLAGALDWTNKKNSPPWAKPGCREDSTISIYEWTRTLGSMLGLVAGIIPLSDFQARFLDPILELEDDNCWALLSPFASTYISVYVYDALTVPEDAVTTLELCLDRLLQAEAFKRDASRSGEFSGFDLPKLVRALMFVSVERADLAARYVNDDWSEINRILPIVDRFIRTGGWAASVMDPFLTLCERARANYPAEAFADQVLAILGDGPNNLNGWHGTLIPARIAELVQHFAHRDTPMMSVLAQKFLRVLDILVDMGDRRSAALQLGGAFREVRLPP